MGNPKITNKELLINMWNIYPHWDQFLPIRKLCLFLSIGKKSKSWARELAQWLENQLLFQRIQVQFPAPLQLLTDVWTSSLGTPKLSSGLHGHCTQASVPATFHLGTRRSSEMLLWASPSTVCWDVTCRQAAAGSRVAVCTGSPALGTAIPVGPECSTVSSPMRSYLRLLE